MSSISRIRQSLLSTHAHHPQNARRVELALREIEISIGELAKLGHVYHLAEGQESSTLADEFPKLVWHEDGRSREVLSKWELLELGPGWHSTLAEARQAHGMSTQFLGRGGIKRSNLPAVIIPIRSKTNGNQ